MITLLFVVFLSFAYGARVCPRGLAGDSCEKLAWHACVVGNVRFDCNSAAPCTCFAECDDDFMLGRYATVCYNTSKAPTSIDDMIRAQTIVYRRKVYIESGGIDCPECFDPSSNQPRALDVHEAIVPLDRWSSSCSGRGVMTAAGSCTCFHLHDAPGTPAPGDASGGAQCEHVAGHKPCVDQTCSGEGHCHNGVCLCNDAQRYGAACELPPLRQTAAPSAPVKIFVYDLPPGFNVYQDVVALDRNTGFRMWQTLIHSPLRTHDWREADFFFIPAFPMGTIASGLLLQAIHYLKTTWPYWNETNGHNHLAVGAYDFGLCSIAGYPEFDRIIQISHYGLTNKSLQHFCACDMCGPSLREGIDIVVPDIMEMNVKQKRPADVVHRRRNNTLFFAGLPTNEHRKEIFALHARLQREDWRIVQGHVELDSEMLNSVFCLDIGGAGFSTRFVLALYFGCVPLYLKELKQPWWDVLPLEEFSVGFDTLYELPDLVERLQNNETQIRTMQFHVQKYWTHFHWTSFFGPPPHHDIEAHDALKTFIDVLKSKII